MVNKETDSAATKRIILLNGPPGCGKDTAARIIKKRLFDLTYSYKMSLPLKEACHKLLGMPGSLEDYEHLKETPIKFLLQDHQWPALTLLTKNTNEITLRQFYMHISENVMKPMFGNDIFGQLAVEKLRQCHHAVATVSDSGFSEEAIPVIKHFGQDYVCLVRIHRPGKEFAGDSRSHIELPHILQLDVENDLDEDKFSDRLWRKIKKNFLIGGM